MADKEQIRRYRAKIKDLFKRSARLDKKGVKQVKKLLEETRTRLLSELIGVSPDTWTEFHLLQLKQATQRVGFIFKEKYKEELDELQKESWGLGKSFIDEPIKLMIPDFFVKEIDLIQLEVAQTATADLITNVSQDFIHKVNMEVQRGIMGEKTPFAIMKEIGRNLKDPSVFKKILTRAEVITRTEIARVQSIASQLRLEEALEDIPELQKQWVWSGKQRVTHAAAHGQKVSIKEDFFVGGEKLKYPLDPKGTARNTINCGCTMVSFLEGWPTLEDINPELWQEAQEAVKNKKVG